MSDPVAAARRWLAADPDPGTRAETERLLEDGATVANEVDAIVNAWTAGDTGALENSLLEGLDKAPRLYDALLVQRNRNWVEPIAALRDEPGNHLVVVGAMHLVGEDSVLEMLSEAGVKSRQLTDADF